MLFLCVCDYIILFLVDFPIFFFHLFLLVGG